MIALGLFVFSTTTLLASACTDWKSVDLKRPDIPSLDNVNVLIEENQSVDIQVRDGWARYHGAMEREKAAINHG